MFRKGTTFRDRGPIHCRMDGLFFSLYSAEEIKSLSVVQVVTPLSFNALGHPLPGGLYDTSMGPYDSRGMCSTCQQGIMHCPGHFGHIELPLPVLNPMFTKTLLQIFRLSCLSCHALTLPGLIKHLCLTQLKLLNSGLVKDAQNAEFIMTEALALEEGGKKIDTKRAETEGMRLKFESYLQEALTTIENVKSGKGDASNQSVESLRRVVMKKILSYAKMNQKCHHCGSTCKKMMLYESKIIYTLDEGFKSGDIKEEERDLGVSELKGILNQKYLTPLEARDHLRETWMREKEFLSYLFPVLTSTRSAHPTDLLFVHLVPVPPPKNRPAQMIKNQMAEHPQNLPLRHVVSSCSLMVYTLQAIKTGVESLNPELARALKTMKGETLNDKLEEVWKELQIDVDHVMDRDKGQATGTGAQMMGLKQVIEKKEGLFRMHMMGKRVNFAARTVITPDPNIHIEEVGIPDLFAKTLTFPTPVTPYNVSSLRKLVLAGPDVHPGAVAVENELGQVSRLSSDLTHRAGIAARLLVSDSTGTRAFYGIKTVYRHLQNGDLLLLNRQPSLHRPSIMAHRARVLYGDKVFRLHYANCKHYNADFDGDEMNAHFPQSHVARSEAASLVNACSNFLVPKDGTPLGGLIQDHVVAGVRMTIRGRFFTREDYNQLLFFALGSYSKHIILEPPTILKPEMLWSGKQIVSSILINLVPNGRIPPTFTSSAKIKSEEWRQTEARYCKIGGHLGNDSMSESCVIFRQGRLLSGILDKVHLGATPYGLCHTFFELYGSAAVGNLLTAFSRLMTNFLQWEGFTLGVKDVLVKSNADVLRRGFMGDVTKVGPQAATEGVGISPDSSLDLLYEQLEVVHRSGDPKARARVDQAYKQTLDGYTNKINRACLPHGLVAIFPSNNLQLLVQSGAKGSTVNTMQMSCLLGQIELEGKRPPLTVAGKSLPSFKQYDPSPRAGGFIAGRFLTGIRPQEFFFHCMAGREGLIDTAVKTSRSGYLQRCLVKLLEGLVTQYDGTVRDSDGTVIQFLYGEDGLDVCKSQYLKEKLLDFHAQNSDSILDEDTMRIVKELGDTKTLQKYKAKLSGWVGLNGAPLEKERMSPSLKFFSETKNKSLVNSVLGLNQVTGRTRRAESLIRRWRDLRPEERSRYEQVGGPCPDPVLSRLRPDSNYGSISEALEGIVDRFMAKAGKSSKKSDKAKDQLRNVLYYKAMKALSSPGDAVGVLAGQSIGEPSTQMTLNTFHFAGRGEMNVTLGIPRLREILMVASARIKTPSMDIPFLPDVTREQAETLRLKLTRVTLAQVLQEVHVTESLDPSEGSRLFTLQFKFLTGSEYRKKFAVKPANALKYFERGFLRHRLIPSLRRLSKMSRSALVDGKESRKGRWKTKDNNDGEDDFEEADQPGKNLFDEAERTGTGEAHQSSDEEPDVEDADATQQTRKKKQGEAEYDAPEEEENFDAPEDEDGGPEVGKSSAEDAEVKPKIHARRPQVGGGDEDEEFRDNRDDARGDEEGMDDLENFRVVSESYESRVSTVLAMDSFIDGYDFDRLTEESCTLRLKLPLTGERVNIGSILKAEAGRGIIHQVKDISRAFITGGAKEPLALKTEGINILAMAGYRSLLDLNRLHCNNIHIMAQHYGIEAASRVIVKEMTNVFKAYGIDLDKRHLTLIGDYMTSSGTYRPFNRFGIESSSSPLHQMSFETVVSFLRDATLGGRRDDLRNPSARLVVGKPTAVGTGIFDLHQRMS